MGAGLREQPRGRHLLVGSLRRAAAAAGGPPSPRGVGGREGPPRPKRHDTTPGK